MALECACACLRVQNALHDDVLCVCGVLYCQFVLCVCVCVCVVRVCVCVCVVCVYSIQNVVGQTVAPLWANALEIAYPRPEAPPVTTTTCEGYEKRSE